jgi:hypothetical protein
MLALGALALAAAGFGAVSLAQFKIFGNSLNAQDEAFKTPNGKAFLEAYAALRENYLRDISPDKLMKGATIGMLDALQDEFTYYLEPEVSASQGEELKGEFFGIGVSIVPANKDGTGVLIDTVFCRRCGARGWRCHHQGQWRGCHEADGQSGGTQDSWAAQHRCQTDGDSWCQPPRIHDGPRPDSDD